MLRAILFSAATAAAFPVDSPECGAVRARLDAFAARQNRPFQPLFPDIHDPAPNRTLTVVLSSGFGDQLSGYLGGLAVAMLTGRRFALYPNDAFFGRELLPTFDFEATDATPLPDLQNHCANASRTVDDGLRVSVADDAAFTQLFCAHAEIGRVVAQLGGDARAAFGRLLDREREFLVPGNTGNMLFRAWLGAEGVETRHHAWKGLLACAFRHAARPAPRVAAAVAALAPWGLDRPPFVVGVHVRAGRYLASAAYGGQDDEPLRNCAADAFQARNFSAVWREAERLEEGKHAVWYLSTDSVALKLSAARAFPEKLVTARIQPRHNMRPAAPRCDVGPAGAAADALNLTANEETVAELLLLAASDALLMAVGSRYSAAAAFLCTPCRRVVQLVDCASAPVGARARALSSTWGWQKEKKKKEPAPCSAPADRAAVDVLRDDGTLVVGFR